MTGRTKVQLKPMDAAWFFIESAQTPPNIGPLLIFTPPQGAPDTFCRDFVEQWRACKTLAPPFNYRIRRTPTPYWEILHDDEIDLDYHLRHLALPAPGGERELGVMVRDCTLIPWTPIARCGSATSLRASRVDDLPYI